MSTADPQHDALAIRLLEAADGGNTPLVDRLAGLVNDVYATAESGLWRDGWARTTTAELADDVRAEEIAVATRDARVVGCIRIHDVADDASEFGMLAADPDQRGSGVGKALVAFVEERSRARGMRAMQLELLVPREWQHPSKEFLKGWYGRMGYRWIRSRAMDEAYPHLGPLLATPCDLGTWEKPLRGASVAGSPGPA